MTDLILILAELLAVQGHGVSESTRKLIQPHTLDCICDECWHAFTTRHSAYYLAGLTQKAKRGGKWQSDHLFVVNVVYWKGYGGQTRATAQRQKRLGGYGHVSR